MDVDRTNFEEILPLFQRRLNEATFVAIDCEYSGLGPPPGSTGHSLFDSAEDRYSKARAGSCYIICQFGIALFRKDEGSNCYYTDCYNFYLFPTFIDDYASDETFLWEVSSIAFLKHHNFDFERCIQKGIPFLNENQIDDLKTYLTERGSIRANDGEDKSLISLSNGFQDKMLSSSSSSPKVFEGGSMSEEDINRIVKHHSGFQRVIKSISQSQKPMVGHNCYTDLTLMYNQFCGGLPESYVEFKADLHRRFPCIYDTKSLAHQMRQMMNKLNPKEDVSYLKNTSLCMLFKNTGIHTTSNRPIIILGPESKAYATALAKGTEEDLEDLPDAPVHQAGFDACLTGAVFTQLAYIVWQKELASLGLIHTRPLEHIFNGFAPFVNTVNMARGWVYRINIAGKDEPSRRPSWIVVKSSASSHQVDVKKIQNEASKQGVGDYEIKYDAESNSAYIACGSDRSKRMMMKILNKTGYKLSEFSPGGTENQIISWTKILGVTTGAALLYGLYRASTTIWR